MDALSKARWDDLVEVQPEETKTLIEKGMRQDVSDWWNGHDFQSEFAETGVAYLPKFIPGQLLDRYAEVRSQLPADRTKPDNFYNGWHYPTPYMICPELRDLALYDPLMRALYTLIRYEMGLHLCLTGWVSTERNWHQDSYLNPPNLWSRYVAVWIALEDIHSSSGPFQYVPGSHLWPTLRREKLFQFLTPDQRASADWPTFTQDHIARLAEEQIAEREAQVVTYLPKRGDVLIWHSNLMHRGSAPTDSQALRKSLICHYSSIDHRLDMPNKLFHDNGRCFFDLPTAGRVRPLT